MEQIPRQLEEKIKELVSRNNFVEAMKLIMKELKLGMKEAKDIMDKYRKFPN